MSRQIERRLADRDSDDALSPEILALLVTCGGEIRESDRAALPEGRMDSVLDRRHHDRRVRDRRGDDRRQGDRRVARSAWRPS